MVNTITLKGETTKLIPLKNRRKDFLRIMHADAPVPVERYSDKHFLSKQFIMRFERTRFPNRHMHFGVTTSIKSVSKLAVERNFARRRVRYALNRWVRRYDVIGWDVLIIARKAILKSAYKELEEEMRDALGHLERVKRRYKYK